MYLKRYKNIRNFIRSETVLEKGNLISFHQRIVKPMKRNNLITDNQFTTEFSKMDVEVLKVIFNSKPSKFNFELFHCGDFGFGFIYPIQKFVDKLEQTSFIPFGFKLDKSSGVSKLKINFGSKLDFTLYKSYLTFFEHLSINFYEELSKVNDNYPSCISKIDGNRFPYIESLDSKLPLFGKFYFENKFYPILELKKHLGSKELEKIDGQKLFNDKCGLEKLQSLLEKVDSHFEHYDFNFYQLKPEFRNFARHWQGVAKTAQQSIDNVIDSLSKNDKEYYSYKNIIGKDIEYYSKYL